jgi:hypothetical protein
MVLNTFVTSSLNLVCNINFIKVIKSKNVKSQLKDVNFNEIHVNCVQRYVTCPVCMARATSSIVNVIKAGQEPIVTS